MSTLNLGAARAIVDGALQHARQQGYKPMGVAVVDAAGDLIAFLREDGASALRLDIATGKAAAAVGMGANSRALAERAATLPAFFATIATASGRKFIPQTGAVLIVDADGKVLGAAGASGGTSDEDENIVKAGIEAAGLRHA